MEKQLESLPAIHERLAAMETWVKRQNGTMQEMAQTLKEVLHNLTVWIEHSRLFEEETKAYRTMRQEKEAPVEDKKAGLFRTMLNRYPLGTGLLLGLILAAVLVLGSDWLRGTLSTVVEHKLGTQPTPTALPSR